MQIRRQVGRAAFLLLCVVAMATTACAQMANEPVRNIRSLDADWLFHKGEVSGAQEPAFNDGDWRHVDVPHDWSIEGPFEATAPARGDGAFLPTGIGWYRKQFSVSGDEKRNVFVEFDGVMANSEVWINGHSLGKRPNGYVSFRYDLTPHVRFGQGEKNVLAVRADTSAQPASRWYAGSGIYRHVRLVVVDPVHVDTDSLFVTTPKVSQQEAEVAIKVNIRNVGASERKVTVVVGVVGQGGRDINMAMERTIAAGGVESFDPTFGMSNPRLWEINSPQMYSVTVRVLENGQAIDQIETPFGIREAVFRADTGFWLNGKNIKIKGVCLHQDGGAFGVAVPLDVWRYRLAKLRELGVNAVRTAHNPPAPDFLDLCDRMGILVMDEFFDCWTVGKRAQDYHLYFGEWSKRDARDAILRDRNHPSVILWSVGNEIHDTPKEELANRILRGLVDVCHENDPTRPVTQALFRPNLSHDYTNGLADMLDVIGTNYRDTELLAAWRAKPERKIIGTEQGHDRAIWLAARDNKQHSGQFLWSGIDYLGETGRWPTTTFNAGLIDRTGVLMPRGAERQSWWSEQPMVRAYRRIAANEQTPTDPGYEAIEWRRRQVLFPGWTPREQEPGNADVEVYSNCEEVELVLNDKSLGAKPLPPDARPRNWRVPYVAGTLLAIGRNAGKEVARDILKTAGTPKSIVLKASRQQLTTGWNDVAVIEAQVVDENGVLVPTAANGLTFRTSGPGRVVATDSGSIVSHEAFQSDKRQAFQGRAVAYVRATEKSGPIEVVAEADGLAAGGVQLSAVGE